MQATSQSKSTYSYWSRLLTAVTGALSILAALRVIIEDSVSALLLLLLDYYRQVVLALFEPLFAWFSITTNAASENYLVYAVFLCLNFWRAALSTVRDWRSRHAVAVVALALYLTLVWVLYFFAGNSPDRPLDHEKILWGSMGIAVIVPIIGMLTPFGIAFWVYLIGYVTYLQFRALSWPFRKLLGAMGLGIPKVSVEPLRLWLHRLKETMRKRLPGRRNPDSSASVETPDPTNELFPESIMWRYIVGVAQGSLAALVLFIVGFAAA